MWNILAANSTLKLEETAANDNSGTSAPRASPVSISPSTGRALSSPFAWSSSIAGLKLSQAAAAAVAAAVAASHHSISQSAITQASTASANSSSSTTAAVSANVHPPPKNNGVPHSIPPTRWTAPVHLDVGGTLYTTTLITLTKYPDSKLAQLFNGTQSIILDELKQHYFLDRDGNLFRHILNFLRCSSCHLTPDFPELEQLVEEALFFQLDELLAQLRRLQHCRRHNQRRLQQQHYGVSPCSSGTVGGSTKRSADMASLDNQPPSHCRPRLATTVPGRSLIMTRQRSGSDMDLISLSGQWSLLCRLFPDHFLAQHHHYNDQDKEDDPDAVYCHEKPLTGLMLVTAIDTVLSDGSMRLLATLMGTDKSSDQLIFGETV